MNILVIGGNRLIGKHLVNELLANNHSVTIANRGITKDNFNDSVKRLVIERTNAESIADTIGGVCYDIIYDSLAFSSNDVKCLLDTLKCKRYIMTSSVSVYQNYQLNMIETDFNPIQHKLKWCWRSDDTYNEVKRQAECALFQCYKSVPSVAVRFPFVVGDDDYTRRLHFYVEHIKNKIPMCIDNLNEQMSFITSKQAGKFLAWFTSNDFLGAINASSKNTISICDIIKYIESKTGITALYDTNGDNAPYNGANSHSMILDKAENLGFEFSDVHTWIYALLDRIIAVCR
jgi:nucleoside-diphosphate-sugar epimerase